MLASQAFMTSVVVGKDIVPRYYFVLLSKIFDCYFLLVYSCNYFFLGSASTS